MPHVNIEIKARTDCADEIRELLKEQKADFKGIDQQVDTYFHVPNGRLKLRQGNIENHLIHYNRPDQEGPKQSDVTLHPVADGHSLKESLARALGILVVVDKRREISFIDNVKFHIDDVKGLGSFVEIEAIDKEGVIGKEKLLEQCHYYMELLRIKESDLVSDSYSDMLLNQ